MQHAATTISRDKSDSLLLLLSCFAVLLPHSLHVNAWVSISSAVLLGWRGWIIWRGLRLPGIRILAPLAMLMMAGVLYQHNTLFGREAGVTMLVLLLTCKLLEMHAKRDLFVVLFLGYFLLLSSFFYQQSILAAAYAVFCIGLLSTAQLSFQFTGLRPPLLRRLRQGFGLLLLAIPLTFCMFILFPRIQGPLWGLPSDANSARTGMSDTMTPGTISELVKSEEIAFRVRFPGKIPGHTALYWRGIVLDQFDGKSWSASALETTPPNLQPAANSSPIEQEIILEPQASAWMYALDLPAAVRGDSTAGSYLTARMELRSKQPLYQRIRYLASSYPANYRLAAEAQENELQSNLLLPVRGNQQALGLARAWRFHLKDDQSVIQRALRMFHDENFSYTLEPPLLGDNPVDQFLFKSRAGFCEHYASAFVFLMRAAGIPARVVTGYQGGSINPVDGYFEVRQYDAHAWSEVWLAGQGWVRIDPTAAVSPERIQSSLQQIFPGRSGNTGVIGALRNNSWLAGMRANWDALNNSWNLWVLNYNRDGQRNLLSRLGLQQPDWQQLSLIFILVCGAVTACMAILLLLRRPAISRSDRLYLAFCKKMAGRGYPRHVSEGPMAYLERLRGKLPAAQFEAAELFLRAYSNWVYGQASETDRQTALKQLSHLLRRCR